MTTAFPESRESVFHLKNIAPIFEKVRLYDYERSSPLYRWKLIGLCHARLFIFLPVYLLRVKHYFAIICSVKCFVIIGLDLLQE